MLLACLPFCRSLPLWRSVVSIFCQLCTRGNGRDVGGDHQQNESGVRSDDDVVQKTIQNDEDPDTIIPCDNNHGFYQ